MFCNSELSLSDIDVYGFDYDYTLARYNQSVEKFIHDSAKKILVEDMKVTGKRRKTLLLVVFFAIEATASTVLLLLLLPLFVLLLLFLLFLLSSLLLLLLLQ